MIYGYARVSTTGQDLSSQIISLKEQGCKKIFQEKFTGTTQKRPEFEKLLAEIRSGDTLVVTKLDRFARSTKDALEIIEDLFYREIRVNILNLGTIENTPSGRLIFTVFSAFADFERDLIVERTQEGKSYAKKSNPNFKEGRPKRKLSKKHLHILSLLENHTYKDVSELTGSSISTITRIRRQYLDEIKMGKITSEKFSWE
jgi:DNA invertase Pin-like site-specific DNA recombinase